MLRRASIPSVTRSGAGRGTSLFAGSRGPAGRASRVLVGVDDARAHTLRLLRLPLMLVTLLGCGPLLYAGDLVDAEEALEQARHKNAKWHAPFEYHSAEIYLGKAREQAVAGQYEDAIRFAHTSNDYSQRAIERSTGADNAAEAHESRTP